MAQSEDTLTTVTTKNHPVATEPALNLKDLFDGIRGLVTSKTNEFFLCEPPTFGEDKDITDPLLSKQWIWGLENIFDCIGCSDEQKVAFAGLRLKDSALSWWTMSKRNMKADGVPVTWEKFKELFDIRYFPRTMKCKKLRELYNFKQGEKTVAEYDAEVVKLCSLVSEFISHDDSELAWLFYNGLSPEMGRRLFSENSVTYPEIQEVALSLERCVIAKMIKREGKGHPP